VICLGLFLLGIFFFQIKGNFWEADRATLQQMFAQVPRGLSFLVIPVLTMRLLAEEKRSGTLEMLITLPIRDYEVVLGKFLGAWGLVLVLIFSTALYPLLMFQFPWHLGALDTGPVLAGYLGLLIYSAAAVSIGLLVSSLTESQVIAAFVTFIILFVLHMLGSGLALDFLPDQAEWVATFISFDSRLLPFVRGLIHPRDVIYFLSITAGCLVAAFWALERRKWA
jgi:ABC-2 type transport system permease protein